MILGKDLRIVLKTANEQSYSTVAGAKECAVSVTQTFIKASSPVSGRVTNRIPQTYDWTIKSSGLVAAASAVNDLTKLLVAGTKVSVRFRDANMNIDLAGDAYVETINLTATAGSIATYSISLVGDGELDELEPNQTLTLTATTTVNDRNISCNGTTTTIDNHSGDHVYLMAYRPTVPTVLSLATSNANNCMFLHRASSASVSDIIRETNSSAFVNPQNGYLAHVHGTTGYCKVHLNANTDYVITWDGSGHGTAKIKTAN